MERNSPAVEKALEVELWAIASSAAWPNVSRPIRKSASAISICSSASERLVARSKSSGSVHPMLVHDYLGFFLRSCKGQEAQLIMTTHESNLLEQDLLRRDEVWFAEKNRQGATVLYSLLDFNPRNDMQLRKNYLQGRFGAVPFLGGIERLLRRKGNRLSLISRQPRSLSRDRPPIQFRDGRLFVSASDDRYAPQKILSSIRNEANKSGTQFGSSLGGSNNTNLKR